MMERSGRDADRVCSGRKIFRIGWGTGQGPGDIARVTTWNRILSPSEIDALPSQLLPNYVATPEDPYISVVDNNIALADLGLLYAENSFASYTAILTAHEGANVFIRNTATRAVVTTGQHIERCYCPAGIPERLTCGAGSYSMPESTALATYRTSCASCGRSETCQGGMRKAREQWEGLCEVSQETRMPEGKNLLSGCSAASKATIKVSDTIYACGGMWGANVPGKHVFSMSA